MVQVRSYIFDMILDDTFFLSDEMGEIRLTIDDNGTSTVWCDMNKHVECYILIKSLDTNLSVNAMGVHSPIYTNSWIHGEPFFLTNRMDFSLGLKVEIFNPKTNTKYLEKCYHKNKRYHGIQLKSNYLSYTHQSYYTFFNDPFFLENFTIRDGDVEIGRAHV